MSSANVSISQTNPQKTSIIHPISIENTSLIQIKNVQFKKSRSCSDNMKFSKFQMPQRPALKAATFINTKEKSPESRKTSNSNGTFLLPKEEKKITFFIKSSQDVIMSSTDSFDISLKKNNSIRSIKEDLLKLKPLELHSYENISPTHFQKNFLRKMSNDSSKKIIYEPVNEEIVNDSEYKTDESEEEKEEIVLKKIGKEKLGKGQPVSKCEENKKSSEMSDKHRFSIMTDQQLERLQQSGFSSSMVVLKEGSNKNASSSNNYPESIVENRFCCFPSCSIF